MKGWPDYTRVTGLVDNYDEYGNNYPVGGGDIAARLGSIKTHDIRGRVWWLEDFEAAVLHWPGWGAGAGNARALSTANAWRGEQSVQLTAGLGAGNRSHIYRNTQRPRSNQIGIEMTYSVEDPFTYISMEIWIHDSIRYMQAGMRINSPLGRIEYMNAAGGWTNTGFDCCLTGTADSFVTSKIVINTTTEEYVRLQHNYEEIELPGQGLNHWAIGGVNQMYIRAEIVGDNLVNSSAYINDVIITVMEPE